MAASAEQMQQTAEEKRTRCEDSVRVEPQPNEPEHEMKTSDYYKTEEIPERFNNPNWFKGYGSNDHPLYRTSNNTYGSKPPSVHTMPTSFHGRSQKFTASMLMNYRSHSLNTSMDKTMVKD